MIHPVESESDTSLDLGMKILLFILIQVFLKCESYNLLGSRNYSLMIRTCHFLPILSFSLKIPLTKFQVVFISIMISLVPSRTIDAQWCVSCFLLGNLMWLGSMWV